MARAALESIGLVARHKKFIAIEQRERAQVALRDVPHFALRVGHDKIAFARLRRVVAAEDLVDKFRVKTGFVDWVGMRNLAHRQRDDLDEQPLSDRHGHQNKPDRGQSRTVIFSPLGSRFAGLGSPELT
ncbi:MAG TPA: hypothetical protein VLI90_15505 [Tepidisphaeraceae bacterium]|nr:hypothetical protein [Tepidisphaeraceae bacterium]